MGNVILGLLLLLGPQTLYSLNKQFEQGPSLFYRASFGSLQSALRTLLAAGSVRIHEETDGGRLKKALRVPDFRKYGVKVEKPGTAEAENCRPLGVFLRDVMKANMTNFRVFGPDENTSNKLNAIYEVSKKL